MVRPLSKGTSTAPAGSCCHAPALASKRNCLNARSIDSFHACAGAFGQVYHCRDRRTGADVAVKTILRGEQMLIKYVRFEVQNHIILRHPNVVDFKVRSLALHAMHESACLHATVPVCASHMTARADSRGCACMVRQRRCRSP